MGVEAEVCGQSGSPRFTCDFPTHNTAAELLGQGGATQQQVSAMCQKSSVMTGCMRRDETVNGGTWDEWFSSHQLHKNTRVLSCKPHIQRNIREKNRLNFDVYFVSVWFLIFLNATVKRVNKSSNCEQKLPKMCKFKREKLKRKTKNQV